MTGNLDDPTTIEYVPSPYISEVCPFHCSGAMLPVDGDHDAVDGIKLLWAWEWRPCFACTIGMNSDLNCNPSVSVPVMMGNGSYECQTRLEYR